MERKLIFHQTSSSTPIKLDDIATPETANKQTSSKPSPIVRETSWNIDNDAEIKTSNFALPIGWPVR